MHLAESTWTDVAAADVDLAVLPVGSTEQHGPHAPLGTDTIAAETVAEAGADRWDREVLVAPSIPVGVAEEHRAFAGTMWVTPDTFRSYVREAVASLGEHGVERVVLVNGHGGNVDALREVAGDLTRAGEVYVVPFTWFDEVEDGPMGHAGPLETAVVQHVAPDLLREDRLEDAAAGAAEGWGEWVGAVNLAFDSDEFSENGVVGDPRDASPARGADLIDAAADALVAVLEAIEQREPGSGSPA